MNKRGRKHMDSLRRRLDWLNHRLSKWPKNSGDPEPVEREIASLQWAIKTIEKHEGEDVTDAQG